MSELNLIDDASHPDCLYLEQLHEALADLLLIHWQTKHSILSAQKLATPFASALECPSLYLIGLQYVYGENSVARSSMRYNLRISPVNQDGPAAETLILELNVRNQKQC